MLVSRGRSVLIKSQLVPDQRTSTAKLCAGLGVLRQGDPAVVDQLVSRAREGEDVGAELTELFRRLGVPEPDPLVRSGLSGGLPGIGAGHYVPEFFVCPADRCVRTEPRRPGVATPRCGLDGTKLRRVDP